MVGNICDLINETPLNISQLRASWAKKFKQNRIHVLVGISNCNTHISKIFVTKGLSLKSQNSNLVLGIFLSTLASDTYLQMYHNHLRKQ